MLRFHNTYLLFGNLTVIFVHFLDDLVFQLPEVQAQVLLHFDVRVIFQREQLFEELVVRQNVG